MSSSRVFVRGLFVVVLLAGLLAGALAPEFASVRAAPPQVISTDIVISQVYGGGGNSGATYKNDFIELFNLGSSPVDVTGWSVQYASSAGSNWTPTILSGTIQPGQYYLIQEASGTGCGGPCGADLPTPEASGSIAMAAGAGKVALVNNSTTLTGMCPSGVVDFVGYGAANCFEGIIGPAPAPSSTMADIRNSNGCSDTDDNSVDFTAVTPPSPRNSSTSIALCMDPLTVTAAANLTGTAASNLTATASVVNITATALAADITGTAAANQTATASAANLTATAAASITPSPTSSRTPLPTSTSPLTVIINEVGWAGTAASSSDEWIELYNPGAASISLNGWHLTALDGSPSITLTGTIPGGGYYLLAHGLSAGTATSPACTVFYPADLVAIDQTFTGSLSNSGEILDLKDSLGNLVDTANSDGGAWPAGSSSTYASMERRGTVLDSSSAWFTYAGSTASTVRDCSGNHIRGTPKRSNWAWTVTATPTPKPPTKTPTRSPTPFPHVVINEFLPRPGFDWNNDGEVNVYDEFIEIENLGPINVTLQGWKLDDEANLGSSPFSLPSKTLKPGERAVYYGSQTHILLDDSGDEVRLSNPRGVIVDARGYSVVKYPDQSHCRIPDGAGYWRFPCSPTPGNENTLTGSVPSVPPDKASQPVCSFADTVPEEFRQAECNSFGADVMNRKYWDDQAGQNEFPVPDIYSKWQTLVE
jgi:lamin tail-like protein